jgi:hypothetical protein
VIICGHTCGSNVISIMSSTTILIGLTNGSQRQNMALTTNKSWQHLAKHGYLGWTWQNLAKHGKIWPNLANSAKFDSLG